MRAGVPPKSGSKEISVESFIRAATNKSDALGALYLSTGNRIFLDELRERAVTDPEAAIFLVIISKRNGESDRERLSILKAAHERFPENGVLTACLIGIDAKVGDPGEVRTLLADFKDVSGFSDSSAQREQEIRDLLIQGGMSTMDAWKVADREEGDNIFALTTVSGLNLQSKLNTILTGLTSEASASVISGVVAFAEALNPAHDVLPANALVATNLERSALLNLPSDTSYGDSGKTVADRISEIDAAISEGNALRNKVYAFYETAPPEVVQSFLERRKEFGELAAVRWLGQIAASN